MIKRPDYNRATNAAYELLVNYNGRMPVIDVFSFVKLLCIKGFKVIIRTYTECAQRNGCSFDYFLKNYASSEHGFTIANPKSKKYIICYNNRKDEATIRFTIAHEVGHIILGHKSDDEIAKKEANCFARNAICPVQISDGFHVNTKDEYVNCFHISEPMAEVTISWRKSDKFYISKANYQKFNNVVYCYFSGYTLAELYGGYGYY